MEHPILQHESRFLNTYSDIIDQLPHTDASMQAGYCIDAPNRIPSGGIRKPGDWLKPQFLVSDLRVR